MLVLDRLERIGARRHDLHHQGSAVVASPASAACDRPRRQVPVAEPSPRRVGDLHVPEPAPAARIDAAMSGSSMFAWKRSSVMPTAGDPTASRYASASRRRRHEVRLVAVQGLDRDPHADPLRLAGGGLHAGHATTPTPRRAVAIGARRGSPEASIWTSGAPISAASPRQRRM